MCALVYVGSWSGVGSVSARGGLPQNPDEAGGGAGAGEPRRGPW